MLIVIEVIFQTVCGYERGRGGGGVGRGGGWSKVPKTPYEADITPGFRTENFRSPTNLVSLLLTSRNASRPRSLDCNLRARLAHVTAVPTIVLLSVSFFEKRRSKTQTICSRCFKVGTCHTAMWHKCPILSMSSTIKSNMHSAKGPALSSECHQHSRRLLSYLHRAALFYKST